MQIRIIIIYFASENETMKDIKDIIRDSGLKVTPQRIAVYQAMLQLGHASADMVVALVAETHPTLTVATVYNILDSFEQKGLLARLAGPDTKMYFDISTHQHCHLYCNDTQSYMDYKDPELEQMLNKYVTNTKIKGYKTTSIDLNIRVELEEQ